MREVGLTKIDLPDDVKAAIKLAAHQQGISEAEVIRAGLRSVVGGERPRPRGGLFSSGEPIARTLDGCRPGQA
jgi:plasmid stability protein